MSAVALCASFPAGRRGEALRPYHPNDIAQAAAAVAEGVLRSGADLLFGAHPTISPIVLQTAQLLSAGPQVHVFQSEYFADRTTDAVNRLVSDAGSLLHRVPRKGSSEEASLTALRRAMFAASPRAAFFCGGMEGLTEEFALAGGHGAIRFLITHPGGMAARLAGGFDEADEDPDPPWLGAAEPYALRGRAYASLVLDALEHAGLREPQPRGPFERELEWTDGEGQLD